MKNKVSIFLFALVCAGLLLSFSLPTSKAVVMCDNSNAGVELKTNMRKLWEDHIIWTRNVILNIVDGLPGTDQGVARLLKNQDDIGNAIKPYYGNEAGDKLTALLKDHIVIAADLLKALKSNDEKALNAASSKWKANGDDIAVFLSKANPAWKESEMKKMMQDHLTFTTETAVARHKKDYDGDIKSFDKVHNEILEMSDMLSMGIIEQFPDKFKSKNK